ncbi:NUDIX hydrolase [Candidatus Saccharibacteria bacterium]|nr:NUDIX hydrolase [Candidatus Saccharibacteria bacterium]
MRKPNTDSNLYSYHLKQIIKSGLVEKISTEYRLTAKGLMYVDRISHSNLQLRVQPKIITMIILKNKQDEVLLTPRDHQPFITRWTLPSGKLHIEDGNIFDAAVRELDEKIGLRISPRALSHSGDVYIRVTAEEAMISCVFAHIFMARIADFDSDNTVWSDATWRQQHKLAPAIDDLIDLQQKSHQQFFAELNYQVDLTQ